MRSTAVFLHGGCLQCSLPQNDAESDAREIHTQRMAMSPWWHDTCTTRPILWIQRSERSAIIDWNGLRCACSIMQKGVCKIGNDRTKVPLSETHQPTVYSHLARLLGVHRPGSVRVGDGGRDGPKEISEKQHPWSQHRYWLQGQMLGYCMHAYCVKVGVYTSFAAH